MNHSPKLYGSYLVGVAVILLPLLWPGFILTLDMVFTPKFQMPDTVTSSYLLQAGLHLLSLIVPSDVVQKLLLISILLFSGIGMHRLVGVVRATKKDVGLGMYVAGIFYMINPFTYSRFMAGQYQVLLGYALLPWFARLLIDFGKNPGWRQALKLGGLAAVIGVVSVHTVGELAILVAVAAGIACWRYRQKFVAYLRYGLVAIAVFVALSSYWLVPLMMGKGATSQLVSQFTIADTLTFATTGQNTLAKLGNIARLQGFWAEDRGLYLLPQDDMVLWGLMALIIIALVVWGGARLWQTNRPALVLFGASGLVAMVLAAGAMAPLARNIPLLAGYREPHKLVGLVALGYSVLLAFGITAALARAKKRSEVRYGIAAGVLLLLPFLFTRTMLWGFDGQLSPRHYPAGWFSVNSQLRQDRDNFAVLFLPWHQYMSFEFAGRIIASPAPAFFDKPVIVSTDPELGGASGGRPSQAQQAITRLLSLRDHHGFAASLAAQNIKYIALAKDLDYGKYDYLQTQPNIKRVSNYDTIALYQNLAWRNQ